MLRFNTNICQTWALKSRRHSRRRRHQHRLLLCTHVLGSLSLSRNEYYYLLILAIVLARVIRCGYLYTRNGKCIQNSLYPLSWVFKLQNIHKESAYRVLCATPSLPQTVCNNLVMEACTLRDYKRCQPMPADIRAESAPQFPNYSVAAVVEALWCAQV